MRGLAFILCVMAMTATAIAEDRLVLTQFEGMPGPAAGPIDGPTTHTISGPKFETLRKDVETVVKLLGSETYWQDLGPDAAFEQIKVYLGSERYVIASWYPEYRDRPNLAVIEGIGVEVVSGPAEKQRREDGNSARYRTIVGLFDKVHSVLERGPEH
jgi:hypothetical protein